MKKPLIIALLVGTLGSHPAFGQFGGGPFAGQQQQGGFSGYPGAQQAPFSGGYPGSQMGWLASPNFAQNNMYSQMGGPVMGAQNYQNQYMQQAGSGMNMVNQCPYNQVQYVDPLDKDPIVAEAKDHLKDLVLDRSRT